MPVDGDGELRRLFELAVGAQLRERTLDGFDVAVLFPDLVADTELVTVVRHALVLQRANLLAQGHFFQHQRIAGAGRFHLGRVRCLAPDILDLPLGGIALAHLLDKASLRLDGLPHAAVEGLLGRIAIDDDFEVIRVAVVELVALADDTAFTLFEVRRTPRRIEVMQRDQPFLRIHAGAHFGRGSQQDADGAGVDLREQVGLLLVGVGVMDEGDFLLRDAAIDEFLFQVIVDGEARLQRQQLIRRHAVQLFLRCAGNVGVVTLGRFHQLADTIRFLASGGFRGGQVDEDQLRALIRLPLVVDGRNATGCDVDLAVRVIRQLGE